MKVKIGRMIFDSDKEPIMLILDQEDKTLISKMGDQSKYCKYPKDYSEELIKNFMKIP